MSEIPIIPPADVKAKVEAGALLVDVRTSEEVAEGSLPGARTICSKEAASRLDEFGENLDAEIVLFCRSGGRSGKVAELLRDQGFLNAHNGGGYEDLREVFGV